MSKISKLKKPELVVNAATADYYKQYGTSFVEEGEQDIGYRYDQITARKFTLPRSSEVKSNNVTLSQPSAEVLTLMKKGDEWYMVLGIKVNTKITKKGNIIFTNLGNKIFT